VQTTTLRVDTYQPGCGYWVIVAVDEIDLQPNTRYHLRLVKRTDTLHGLSPGERLARAVDGIEGDRRSRLMRVTAPVLAHERRMALETTAEHGSVEGTGGQAIDLSVDAEFSMERLQGMARSRVRSAGAVVDTVLYDWFFATGRYATFEDKVRDVQITPQGRFLVWPRFTVTTNEPIDDDFTAMVFLRGDTRNTTSSSREWLQAINLNDRYSRDRDYLRDRVGTRDAGTLRNVITWRSPTYWSRRNTYVDAGAPWNFDDATYQQFRLRPHEMIWEVRPPATLSSELARRVEGTPGTGGISGGGGFGGLGGAGGGLGGLGSWGGGLVSLGSIMTSLASGYSEDAMIFPYNAHRDFTEMRWRYTQAFNYLGDRVSSSSRDYLLGVATRAWSQVPNGRYNIGFVQKTRTWRQESARYYPIRDIILLELISRAGDARNVGFGEIRCADPGRVPVIKKTLEVR
jgi:hypothetical protein